MTINGRTLILAVFPFLVPPIAASSTSLNFCEVPEGYRIIGGRSTTISKWPWQALFFNFADSDYGNAGYGTMCGATVLNEKWILTAAHCVLNASPKSYVNVGVTSLKTAKKTLKVAQVFIHPQFDLDAVLNDIALVQVKGKIPIGGDIQPVCLSEDDGKLVRQGAVGIVTGFGLTMESLSSTGVVMQPSDQLLETEVPLMEPAKCTRTWKSLTGGTVAISKTKQLCAGSLLHGTAPGDSGGPLHVADARGQYVQVGVTSFGANGLEGLVDQATYPGVYTRVSAFLPWIKSTVGYVPNSNDQLQFFLCSVFVMLSVRLNCL